MYYAFSIEFTTLRPGSFAVRHHGSTCGVVRADSLESAQQIVWDKLGNDYAHSLMVFPVTEDFVIISES